MSAKTSSAPKATEPQAKGTRTGATPPGAPGLAGAFLDFQSAVGNRSAGRLLQPKLRESPSPAEEEPAAGTEEESPAPPEPASEAPEPEGEPAPALIVDDEARTVGPGQMTKGEFFARLRTEACAAAEAGLAGTLYSARGCPLIEFWVGYYERQSVERINRDLPRFAGEGPRPTTAEGSIALITERVRTSVATWARTGKVTGVPQGIPLPGMGLPGLGGLGGVFFKANSGGPRDPGDPRALQARLGAGRPLDGGVRSRMESVFGRGFSHVRVHCDSGAAGLATSLNAKAFTVGEHVAFGAQEYQPGTLIGDALIAHELAHVAQQGDGTAAASAGYDTLERDADLAGASAVASLWGGVRSLPRPVPRVRSGLRLQRCGGCNRRRVATTPPAAGPPAACAPTPVSLKTVVDEAKLPNETVLGYTDIDRAASKLQCRPKLAKGASPGTCSFTPMPIELKLISKSVKEGDHPHPQNRTMPSVCGELPIVLQVTDPIARLAKEGEQEHCADLRLAFDRTLKPCQNALERLKSTELAGRNEDECFADLEQKLGFNPAACTREFWKLVEASRKRDQGWHTFEPYRHEANCQRAVAVYRYRPAKTNRIAEKVKSEAVVPAATGCTSPVAAPASPPPPPQSPPGGGTP